MSSNKLLSILTAAGLTVGGLGTAASIDSAAAKNLESESSQTLEALLQQQSAGVLPPEAFDVLASRFKAPGERGRPGIFGPPGPPEIGPPGQYSG